MPFLEYPHNVSRLIFRGFLTMRVHIGSHSILLKTINENEYDDIELYSGIRYEDLFEIEDTREREIASSKLSPWLLAWSTLLVNFENVLEK